MADRGEDPPSGAQDPPPGRGAPGPAGTIHDAPAFRVPAEHFAASLLFLVAGGAGLAWQAPAIAAGAVSVPGVVASAHLLTVGWLGTSVLGALYQLLPVALGATLRWERLADTAFWAWTAGLAAFAAGIVMRAPTLHVPGAALVGVGVLLFAANVAATLPRTARRDLTWWCVAGGTLFLLGGWVLGLLLAVNLGFGVLGDSRYVVLTVHLHLAAGGWILLTVIGVGHRLLPMFLGSRGSSRLPGRIAAGLVAAGAGALLLSGHLLPAGVLRPALAALGLGTLAFLAQARFHYRNRTRSELHPALRLVAGGLVLLGLAVVAGAAALTQARPAPRLLTAYGLLLVPGGLGLFVAGIQYRIVPFLTWTHRYAARSGGEGSSRPAGEEASRSAAGGGSPRPGELVDARGVVAATGLLFAGAALLAVGALAGSAATVRAGGIAFTGGAVVEAGQLLAVLAGWGGRPGPGG